MSMKHIPKDVLFTFTELARFANCVARSNMGDEDIFGLGYSAKDLVTDVLDVMEHHQIPLPDDWNHNYDRGPLPLKAPNTPKKGDKNA